MKATYTNKQNFINIPFKFEKFGEVSQSKGLSFQISCAVSLKFMNLNTLDLL